MTVDRPSVAREFPPPRTSPFDPPDVLAELRAAEQLGTVFLWDGRPAWLVTRYSDARFVLSDHRFSSDIDNPGLPALRPGLGIARHRAALVRMDNPRHGEIRRMVAHEFTPSRATALRPTIERIVADQLDTLLGRTPPVDLRAEFALPVPSRLICELLGVPLADQDFFQECTRRSRARGLTKEQGIAAEHQMYDYCDQLVARKEQEPTADLIGRLIVDAVRPGRLSREELVTMAKALINAGHETTASMLCLGALTILLHPDWFRAMRAVPAAVPNAVEELLRYHTIVHDGVPRVATEDVVVGNTPIRAGDGLVVSVASANRDQAMFDNPDGLDLGRAEARRHLAFGHGAHLCLGLWLARAELQIALPALAARVPSLRLAVPLSRLRFCEDMQIYGVHELPVTW
jgi:cytochrome P450